MKEATKLIEIDGKRYYSTKGVAEKLGVSVQWINQLRKTNQLECYQLTAAKFLFEEGMIVKYLMGKNKTPVAPVTKEIIQEFRALKGE